MIAGLILAGGRSSRFGSEKAMALVGGRPMIAHVAERLAADCAPLAVSAAQASGAAGWAHEYGLEVLHDAPGDAAGPLAGLRAGLMWAKAQAATLLATLPCDLPQAPADLFTRLHQDMGDARIAFAETSEGPHPLCGLWRIDILPALNEATAGGRHPAVQGFAAQLGARRVWFEEAGAFANLNRPGDLAKAAPIAP